MLIPLLDSDCVVGGGVPPRLPPSEGVVLWPCVAVLVEAGGVVLVLLLCVLVDDAEDVEGGAVLIETVGAGCTCKAAPVITAQFGTELIVSCALMLASVSAVSVLIACVDPPSCSMVRLTDEVGANNLLAAVCSMVRSILQFWHCTERRAGA
jgi:hypothetical protein